MSKLPGTLFLIAVLVSCPVHAGDWPAWRHDAQHTGGTADPLPAELHLQWERQLPALSPAWPASQTKLQFDAGYEPVAAGTTLFVGSNANDTVTAYDTRTGAEKWRFYTDGPVRFAPAVWQDRVLATSDDGFLYCLRADNGELLWRVNGGPSVRPILGSGRLVSTWPARGGVVVVDGVAYFAAGIWPSMGIFVHAVDVVSGEILWTNSETGGLFLTHPHGADAFGSISPQGHLAVSGDLLIVPGGRTLPGVFDRHTGKLLHFDFGGKGNGGHDVLAAGPFYLCGGAALRSGDGRSIGQFPASVIADAWVIGNRTEQQITLTSIDGKTEDRIVTDRRGKEQTVTVFTPDRQQVATMRGPARVVARAGERLITAEPGFVGAVDLESVESASDVVAPGWRAEVGGNVWTAIVADDRLFVVTYDARLLCFGAEQPESVRRNSPLRVAVEPMHDGLIHELVEFAGTEAGYAVALGVDDARLIAQLAQQTSFDVIGIDGDDAGVTAARRSLDELGLYGDRVALIAADPFRYEFPPYLASLLVADRSHEWTVDELRGVYDTLRPYGGCAVLKTRAGQYEAFVELIAEAGCDNASCEQHGQWTVIRRVGPLPGSGDWTHQYGDASQSGISHDALVKAPFGVLWFGGPSNDKVLPRHGHGPAPQVAGGRAFIEGPDMLRAVDVYTGRLWWEREFPGLGTFYDVTSHQPGAGEIGSNYVSLEDHVYVIYGDRIHELDAQTGETSKRFRIPGSESAHWGALAVDGDALIAAASPVVVEGAGADDSATLPPDARVVIEPQSDWQYLAGSDPAGDWTAIGFDAGAWKTGAAGFGYGDGDDKTELHNMKDHYTRVYIRRTFDANQVGESPMMTLAISYDDAFIAYLNGREIVRRGVGRGRGSDAGDIGSHEADGYETIALDGFRELLRAGENVLAIEGHNTSAGSSDFTLDPYLYVKADEGAAENTGSAVRIAAQLALAEYSSSSRRLVVFDRHTGEQLWSREAAYSFRHNAICAAKGIVFCIDGMSPEQLSLLRRRGVAATSKPQLLALDARTGDVVWSTDEDVFGTFLNYSTEQDVLLQAGSPFRDRAEDEVDAGMIAYRGTTGDVLWKQLDRRYNGPCLLWKDRIITNGTGGYELDLLTGESTGWEYVRMYGCNTAIGSENLLTFRSGAAGFCDLEGDSGTGNLGGFRSSCTSNLIVADGVLSAPDYTRTCVCAYQLQTSLAFIHMPEAETWTFNRPDAARDWSDGLALNLGAPGDRADDEGQVWLEYPAVGGPSPQLRVTTRPEQPNQFRRHSALLPEGELRWVAASGLVGVHELSIELDGREPRPCTVTLVFNEPEGLAVGKRVFSVSVQGQEVLSGFDPAAEAGQSGASIVIRIPNVMVGDRLVVTLAPDAVGEVEPVLCGIKVAPEVARE